MKDILHKTTVLLLNRNWQAIHTKTPADAFCMMATGAATGLDVRGDDHIVPVPWEDWLKLPVREEDHSINTPRGPVRVPTVIVAARYAKVPICRPRFGSRGIWERDGGVCQYTGRKLAPGEGNIDHVIPRSRGGASSWENCVLSHRAVNERKADRLPHEAGLRLLRSPAVPRSLPASVLIRNHHDVGDWQRFLMG
ncbi:MAG: HNH endonuclease [Luteolibacter sp.]|uniref:HNH endonuclease n=1 Tax=Luteolibacter sp. TaxID=1962973 RepID=UPI003267CA1F